MSEDYQNEETQEERLARYAKIAGRLRAKDISLQPDPDGVSMEHFMDALRRGSTPEAKRALNPIVDTLILSLD